MAYLYSLNDFSIPTSTSKTSNTSPPSPTNIQPPLSLASFNDELVLCLKEAANKTQDTNIRKSFYNGNVKKLQSGMKYFPCQNIEQLPSSKSYCAWHDNYFQMGNEKEFLTIMKYAHPQRKMTMQPKQTEKKLAQKVFGPSHIKLEPSLISPMSMGIFCHKIDQGFYGEDIGITTRVCNDFFPSPTDQGICLTKNFQIDKVMKTREVYNNMFEQDVQPNNSKIEGGTLWSEITLVVFTDATYFLSQSYPRDDKTELGKIQLQLHQTKDLANMLLESNYDEKLVPLSLQRGKEYFINVKPDGNFVTKDVMNLDPAQRECFLEDEVPDSSVFKIYTENNCKYECKVFLAQQICKCIPWDFFLKETSQKECDVFGRSCFYDTMTNLTQAPEIVCEHCMRGCNKISYGKSITKEQSIPKQYSTHEAFDHFLMDKNNTIEKRGFKMAFDSFTERNCMGFGCASYDGLRISMMDDAIIIHLKFQKPEIVAIGIKYTTDDKIVKFGGTFGIFSQLTGCTFLGLLNMFAIILKLLFMCFKTRSNQY